MTAIFVDDFMRNSNFVIGVLYVKGGGGAKRQNIFNIDVLFVT